MMEIVPDPLAVDALAEARAILSGESTLTPTVEHLAALEECYECRLIRAVKGLREIQDHLLSADE